MDIYLTSLALGGVGLVAMAASGISRDGHGHHGDHGASHGGHASHHGDAQHGGSHHAGSPHADHGGAGHALLSLMSPRVLFSLCLGFGTFGLLIRPFLSGVVLAVLALLGAVLFERFLVTPVWNFTFRFASNPAQSLESAIAGEATAVTSFDANGQGLIAIEMDGQIVQLLGTLQLADREMRVRVPAGARLRVEDVDAARNRCSVSLI